MQFDDPGDCVIDAARGGLYQQLQLGVGGDLALPRSGQVVNSSRTGSTVDMTVEYRAPVRPGQDRTGAIATSWRRTQLASWQVAGLAEVNRPGVAHSGWSMNGLRLPWKL